MEQEKKMTQTAALLQAGHNQSEITRTLNVARDTNVNAVEN